MIDERRFEALNEAVAELLQRQRDLERRLARLEGIPQPEIPDPPNIVVPPPLPAPGAPPPAAIPNPILTRSEEYRETPHEPNPAMETKVGLTVVNRVGVVTLILGVAFFFKWAVDNNWIGPAGRVLIGLTAGCAALAIADFLWRKAQQIFAQGVAGAGIAILYLALYAAFGFYHLIPQSVAFAFMVGTTALGFALSLRYASAAIAMLGLFGGYLTPFLLSTGEDRPWFLLSYVLLLDLAAMSLVKRKQWQALATLAFIATTLIYFVWFHGGEQAHRGTAVATLAALAYYALFAYAGPELIAFASNIAAAAEIMQVWQDAPGPFFAFELLIATGGLFYATARRVPVALTVAFVSFWAGFGLFFAGTVHSGVGPQFTGISAGFLLFFIIELATEFVPGNYGRVSTQSLSILAANGSVYFGFAYLLLQERYHGWLGSLAVGVAGTYLAVAALLWKNFPAREHVDTRPVLVALGMALAFITLAIPIQLAGFHITIAWAVQAAALTWIAAKLRSRRALLAAAFIFVLVSIRLIVSDAWLHSSDIPSAALFLNARFATFAIAAACGFLAAKWAASLNRRIALWEYLGAHAAMLTGLTLEILAWAQKSAASANLLSVETVSVSILFALYALALVAIGVATRTAVSRIAGLALAGFVIAKLYLFDVWQLGRVCRIAAFIALGLLLITTSFLYSRFRHVIEALLRNDDTAS